MGFISFFAGIASESCATTRCVQIVGTGWVVLVVTQLAIGGIALPAAALARRQTQLAAAVVLGTAGPIVAFCMFVIVAGRATGGT